MDYSIDEAAGLAYFDFDRPAVRTPLHAIMHTYIHYTKMPTKPAELERLKFLRVLEEEEGKASIAVGGAGGKRKRGWVGLTFDCVCMYYYTCMQSM